MSRDGVPAASHSQPDVTPSPCCAFSGPERWLRGERSGGASLRYALFVPIRGGAVEQVEQIYRNKYNIYNLLSYNVYSGVIGKRCFTRRWRCVSYMKIAPPLHLWPARLVSHSRNRSSTLRRESGNRTYIITASRMTSGLVLK